MEADGGGGSGGEGGGGGGASVEADKKNLSEGEPKVKRKMKTPSQLEILEKTYAMETYPSEALRAELSVKLGLSDRQLQMWFCHRRLKDRKAPIEKRPKKGASSSVVAGSSGGSAYEADEAKESGSGLSLFGNMDSQQRVVHKVGTAVPRISTESPSVRRFYEPPLAISEQRAIKFVEAQLGEPLREDGPILGMEFDPLPPGAFGAPIVTSEQQKPAGRSYDAQLYESIDAKPVKGASRALHEYQFLPEKPSVRNDAYERAATSHYYGSPTDIATSRVPLFSGRSVIHNNEQVPSAYLQGHQMPSLSLVPQQGRQDLHLSPAPGEVDVAPPIVNANSDSHHLIHPITGLDNQITTPDRRIILDQERLERKRKTEEARIAKEVEAHEKRMRKEIEKQDILRRKREEQMRKEMERQDRERRKEEERLLREKQREEERFQREQRREMERREKFLQKEYIRAEKMRLKEEMRREKEAARLKAANNRAAARRIAKESTELIEDERLELMELAALSRDLPSILALDSETLQNLVLFKDKLPEFPPKSVPLKKPFGVQPWTDSEGNVGNLLMVWRFLIAFADVLGLWPFTLDEFTQALHGCDPRLLGEIHIALLRSIIKDIEDVARTPATAMIANQNSAGIPAGGHPRIVEGAYAWGFDLLSWRSHLSPLTWPEVLRQFALSAGFGPKLKKRNMKSAYLHDENEGDDGADNISNLRSGVAAENAVAIMQERGLSNPRRSRHRLTPGTVKFAAFHVLSLEGSKGLSILEVADKIQRSGLRDLTTSKTPEASISAALSRDTKLFERTAPSTYCVRAPYRKDPADAEEILSTAREKVRVYQNGSVEEEEVEDVEKDYVERDQDSESDVNDDPDVVDDLDAVEKLKAESISTLTQSVDEIKRNGITGDVIVDLENALIDDDCGPGEAWVEGLSEGEYADLSTEERLNALVALIGVANEGNAIRITLEERLEAASALKKQMWAEAQLDKRRMKEEHILKLQHFSVDVKNEPSSRNPVFQMVDLNDQQTEENFCNNINLNTEKNPLIQESPDLLLQQSVYAAERSRSYVKSLIGHRAEEMYVYRSLPLGQDRRRNRYWQFITSPSPNDPGSGRIFVELQNGVWKLIDSEEGFDSLLSSLDVRGIRESHLHSVLQTIGAFFKEAARRNLLRSNSGVQFHGEVKKRVPKPEFDSSTDSPNSVACAPYLNSPGPSDGTEENNPMNRYRDFEEWIGKESFDSNVLCAIKYGALSRQRLIDVCSCCHMSFSWEDNHCPSCHRTFSISDKISNFTEHLSKCKRKQSEEFDGVLINLSLPPRIRLLKYQLATIEASIPSDALESVWTDEYRKSWGMKLHSATTADELLQILTLLEDSIKREFLSAKYETTSEVLNSCNKVIGCYGDTVSRPEAVAVLPWIPQTTSAVALRIMELDSSIYYTLDQKAAHQKDNEARNFLKFPSVYSAIGSSKDNYLQQDSYWVDMGNGRTILKRGRGRPRGPSRTRGAKSSNLTKKKGKFALPGWKGRSRARGGSKKGRRSIRSRQKAAAAAAAARPVGKNNNVENRGAKGISVLDDYDYDDDDDDTAAVQQDECNLAEMPLAENASSSERSEFDNDENVGQASSGDEYEEEDLLVDDDFSDMKRVENGEDDEANYDEEYIEEEDEEEEEDGRENYYVDGYINSDYNEEGNQPACQGQDGNLDRSSDRGLPSPSSSSSEYSY